MSAPEYIDDNNVLELFASDLHHVERAGPGVLRLTFVIEKGVRIGRAVCPVVHVLVPAVQVDGMRMRLAEGVAMGSAEAGDPSQDGASRH